MRASQTERAAPDWVKVLVDAVNKPGVLSAAYSRFWNYSVGNQLLAMFECMQRGLDPGPIHTFNGWLEIGRHVKKGEKAITLCMPVTVKRRHKKKEPPSTKLEPGAAGDEDSAERITVFTYKPHWFVLSQTEGKDYVPTVLPEWSETRVLPALQVDRVPFTHPDGNCQGFARLRQVAVSPIAMLPHKTLFHELAHVILGHTEEGMHDDHDRTPKTIREVEAECVALICCESLNLPGAPESRGYIQHWLGQSCGNSEVISERSVRRIFKASDAILKAGRPFLFAKDES
jgi:antirestriction protein ArdC